MTSALWAMALLLAADPAVEASADWSLARMMEDTSGAPREREASGTGWQPATTPMMAHHLMGAGWMVMLHYAVFAGVDVQLSQRGATRPASANWVMAMDGPRAARRPLQRRTMLTLEPLTVGGEGFPLSCRAARRGWASRCTTSSTRTTSSMEASVGYQRAIGWGLSFELYAAPSGEPRPGAARLHARPSASSDPLPPLGHHWQDSTHVSFGVLTAGLFNRWAKLEASWFTAASRTNFAGTST